MNLRRKTIRLHEGAILRMLNLPEGTEVRAVQSYFDPPSIAIGLTHPDWPEIPPDSEAPLEHLQQFRYSGGLLSVTLASLPEPIDPAAEREEALRELLSYCRGMAAGNESGDAAEAYEDAANKLVAILDGRK